MKLELVDPYSPHAERIWRELEATRPPGFFLTWGWVENWLACLPHERAPRLALMCEDARPIAACFLGRQLKLRHRVLPTRAMFVNATGVDRVDNLWIEYNGVVGRDLSIEAFVDLLPGGWDEVFLPGLSEDAFGGLTDAVHARYRVRVERRVPSYYVDLDKARAKGYLPLLSGQTRSQVRRSQREAGEPAVEVATDESHAIDIYSELTALHGAQWREKGKPGAFADPWFDRFHRRLIARRLEHGEIQLLRVRAGGATIGCLYNFICRDRVLQYQSGLATFENPHLKPGFIVHTAAIEHAAKAGLGVYDFLGGDMRYKKSLSTDCGWLVWARVQRRRLRFAIEERIVAAHRERRARDPART